MRISFKIILFLYCSISFGQKATIQFDKNSFAYYGVDNPTTIGVENMNCDSILIISKRNQILKSSTNKCKYIYKPISFNTDTLTILKILNYTETVIIDTKFLTIKPLPLVGILNNMVDEGIIQKEDLIDFPARFKVCAHNTGLDLYLPVDSFLVKVKRNCELSYTKYHKKNDDFSELLKEFSLLNSGDEIIFPIIWYTFNELPMADNSYLRLEIK